MPRTDAQRRADALTAIFARAVASPPGSKLAEPVVNILVDHHTWSDLMTLAGLFPERDIDPFEPSPQLVGEMRCETSTGELIDPYTVLQASLENHVRFVILNDEGVPIRWGRKRRLFSGAARDAVASRSASDVSTPAVECVPGAARPITPSNGQPEERPAPTTVDLPAHATTGGNIATATRSTAIVTATGTRIDPTAARSAEPPARLAGCVALLEPEHHRRHDFEHPCLTTFVVERRVADLEPPVVSVLADVDRAASSRKRDSSTTRSTLPSTTMSRPAS